MIEKLRRQFIIVAMCSTLAVLTVIIGTLNVISYRTMVDRTDAILEMLAENNGHFPDSFFNRKEPPADGEKYEKPTEEFLQDQNQTVSLKNISEKDGGKRFFREMPYETRFFFVKINSSGLVSMVDTGKVASVETQEAIDYALMAWDKYLKKQKGKGFLNDYRYMVTEKDAGYLIIFVDAEQEMESARNVLVISLFVSMAGLLAVFVLVVVFSRIVFRPVEVSYQKQRQFITDASHELKTPLTIISANVEVLEMESEESQWSISIKNQIQRMIGLVEQMVTLSRMDEDTCVKQEKMSLSEAVRDTAELFLPVAEGKGKSLELDIQGDIRCMGDEKQLRQLVSLLVDNAVKYAAIPKAGKEEMKKGGPGQQDPAKDASWDRPRIRLTLRKKGRRAELCLWNTVQEVSQGNQDILFERFYRPDSSRNAAMGGSGIGLSIAKSIVETHKGKITAVSRDGSSIEFIAVIPIL